MTSSSSAGPIQISKFPEPCPTGATSLSADFLFEYDLQKQQTLTKNFRHVSFACLKKISYFTEFCICCGICQKYPEKKKKIHHQVYIVISAFIAGEGLRVVMAGEICKKLSSVY